MARRKKLSAKDERDLGSFVFAPLDNWWGGRNYSRDLNGEVVPAEGYSFTKELFRSDVMKSHGRGPAFSVSAALKLNTSVTKMKLTVQHSGSASSETIVVNWTDCRSIKAAKIASDAFLRMSDWVGAMRKHYYANRYEIAFTNGESFCTMFDEDFFLLPEGVFIVTSKDGSQRRVIRSESGYGTAPMEDAEFYELLRKAMKSYEALPEEEKEKMRQEQRESWVYGQLRLAGRNVTRTSVREAIRNHDKENPP